MKFPFSTLVERLFTDPPWAVCPAEPFPERFAELEQRLRAAYPAEKGFRTRATRGKDSWVVHVRRGFWSGFAVQCDAVYEAESFGPTRVSVRVEPYSRVVHLAVYLLAALVASSVLAQFGKFLVPKLSSDPLVLALWDSGLLSLLAAGVLVFLLATVQLVVGRSRRGEAQAQLEEVRALVRAVLAADDRALWPERVRARRAHRFLAAGAVCLGPVALGVGCWALWGWWSYWDDPLHAEMARVGGPGVIEILQQDRNVNLVFGAILSLAGVMLFWGYALARRLAPQEPPGVCHAEQGTAGGRPSE